MATQSDLDKLRKQLSDLDAKLKSMRGNSPQRNPNFDLAMANQNFNNSMAEQRARIEADRANRRMAPIPPPERGQYTQGRLMGAPSGGQDFIDSRDPNKKYTQDMVDYIDPATGEKVLRTRGVIPAPGSRFVRANQAGMYGQRASQGSQVGGGLGGLTADQAGISPEQRRILDDLMANQPIPPGSGLGGLTADQAGIPVDQRKILDDLMAKQAQQPIPPGGGMGGSIGAPENMRSPNMPQDIMAAYNNFLQQGIQRSNTMNQDAATNFANLQAGAPTTQPAAPAKANPTMPIAGMGMQQPKATPAPRKFSTVNTPFARFG